MKRCLLSVLCVLGAFLISCSGEGENAVPVEHTAAAPVFSPEGGAYESPLEVTLATLTKGAVIRYTLDGSDPGPSTGSIYSGVITIDRDTTVRAVTIMDGWKSSGIAEAQYEIHEEAPEYDVVSLPEISPGTGVYHEPAVVVISCSTEGAQIRYTLDGGEPSETNGIVYMEPITISSGAVLRAIAFREGMIPSGIARAEYVLRAADPEYSPAPGEYNGEVTVELSCATEGARLYYTLDGSDPDELTGTPYLTPLWLNELNSETVIRARAFMEGMDDSNVSVGEYGVVPHGTVAEPTFTPAGGSYESGALVTLQSSTDGAVILYTTDGSDPEGEGGIAYNEPIEVSQNLTIRAIAVKTGWLDSETSSSHYVIRTAAPSITPQAGVYSQAFTVTLACATEGSEIRYTLDGSDPGGDSGITYGGPVTIDRSRLVRAIAIKNGCQNSEVNEASYTLRVSAPVFSPAPGTYRQGSALSMSTATEGAEIRYTTDGSDPREGGLAYNGPLPLSDSITLRAVAVKEGWADSGITEGVYQVGAQWMPVGAPRFSEGSQIYDTSLYVHNHVPYVAYRGGGYGNCLNVQYHDGTQWRYAGYGGGSILLSLPGGGDSATGQVSLFVYDNGGSPVIYMAFTNTSSGLFENRVSVISYNGTSWTWVGGMENRGISAGEAFRLSLYVYNNNGTPVPYVAFSDGTRDEKLTVMKYTQVTGWTTVGSAGFTPLHAFPVTIKVENEQGTAVPYVSHGGGVHRYNGASWVSLSDSWTQGGSFQSLSMYNGVPYVLNRKWDQYALETRISVLRYNESKPGKWEYVGDQGFVRQPGSVDRMSLFIDEGRPYVAWGGDFGRKASVLTYTGGSWVWAGSPDFSDGSALYHSLFVYQGVPYISYADETRYDQYNRWYNVTVMDLR